MVHLLVETEDILLEHKAEGRLGQVRRERQEVQALRNASMPSSWGIIGTDFSHQPLPVWCLRAGGGSCVRSRKKSSVSLMCAGTSLNFPFKKKSRKVERYAVGPRAA